MILHSVSESEHVRSRTLETGHSFHKAVLMGVLLLLIGAGHALRAESPRRLTDSLATEIQEVFHSARDSVCRIRAVDSHGVLHGTGFFIDPTGTVVTIYSVGGESNDITIEFEGRKYTAARVLADRRSGIVLLKVEAETGFLPMAESGHVELATPVVSVGYAMDLDVAPSFGTIAGFDIKYMGRYFPVTHLRASLPVMRGQAGSPLLNLDGEVVGVLVSGIDKGAACYALPVSVIEKVTNDYARFGAVRHGWIGVTVEPSIPGYAESSAKVADIDESSPAAETGLRPGDILVRIGGHEIDSPEDVLDASFYLSPGDQVDLVVRRGDRNVVIPAHVADHPANPKLHARTPALLDSPTGDTLELGN